ncbi:CPBP family intramembrane glutamic endopeptidase [Niallia nealsonii]|uniref:CPBP family intramembrane metalloprotease n=1 Tax=Niallia nealsonii TaxID=115979 RepID=A0A2N0YZN7_9BACI|nr:type II CAAX endopeptidase family protein [Niallia nealsonii]PKG22721.1 CPBP family intramembrane metalloprotease [Niallia nealsonii]
MKKEYWIILTTYIAMQFSSIIGIPLLYLLGSFFGFQQEEMRFSAVVIWLILSFAATLIIVLLLLRHEFKNPVRNNQANLSTSISWAVGGIFLSLFAQSAAGMIESLFGVTQGSENTERLMTFVERSPIVILVISIIGPILEEVVFRKIIFGTLYKRLNFFLSALISSILFALAHNEFSHILLYASMGFTFAYLYVKTKRILVPIFAHVSMNTLVVVIQLNQDTIQKWMEQSNQITKFIGGF